MAVPAIPPGTELLDDLEADPERVEQSLRNIARANRWFGGVAAARFGLERILTWRAGDRIGLLDVGIGAGDLPRQLALWAARRGIQLVPVGVERHPVAARLARGEGIPTILADGGQLPLADRSIDVVLLSQIAHHLTGAELCAMARECTRVARIGVILSDLRPAPWAPLGYRLASLALGFDRWTREDGVVSIRRGFTAVRLAAALESAGIEALVTERPGARVVAVWRA